MSSEKLATFIEVWEHVYPPFNSFFYLGYQEWEARYEEHGRHKAYRHKTFFAFIHIVYASSHLYRVEIKDVVDTVYIFCFTHSWSSQWET